MKANTNAKKGITSIMTTLNIGRASIVLGFIIGLISLSMTISHIGDTSYLIKDASMGEETHAWYHALREVCGNIAAMATILTILFGKAQNRTPFTWALCLMLMLGYYLPFWIGTPFIDQLQAPNLGAEFVHITMAGFAIGGLLYLRKDFIKGVIDV